MKVGKPTGKQVVEGLALTGGVAVGMKASKGVASISPIPSKIGSQLAIAGLGLVLAFGVKGSGPGTKFVNGSGAGMAAQQFGEIIDEAVAGKLPDSKAIQAAFGNETAISVKDTKAALAAYRNSRMGNPGSFQLGNGFASANGMTSFLDAN